MQNFYKSVNDLCKHQKVVLSVANFNPWSLGIERNIGFLFTI